MLPSHKGRTYQTINGDSYPQQILHLLSYHFLNKRCDVISVVYNVSVLTLPTKNRLQPQLAENSSPSGSLESPWSSLSFSSCSTSVTVAGTRTILHNILPPHPSSPPPTHLHPHLHHLPPDIPCHILLKSEHWTPSPPTPQEKNEKKTERFFCCQISVRCKDFLTDLLEGIDSSTKWPTNLFSVINLEVVLNHHETSDRRLRDRVNK